MNPVRVRFPPSPTGLLHVGGIRTALFNYLFATQTGGNFILRLEDTDQERFVADSIDQIVAGLDWVGLRPDEGFWISDGEHQNSDYIQSERHKRGQYQKWADQLIAQDLAYYSQISPASYSQLKNQAGPEPFVYKRTMEPTGDDTTDRPIRLDTAAVGAKLKQAKIDWADEIHGQMASVLNLIEDFIIIKSDSFPTYNFANVIDDHDMQISHVIRGSEFIASTAKHVLLYQILNWPVPKFAHLPVINGADGKKLSKRSGDTDVLDYRAKGYLPEALINFLALLGWNPGAGETQEIFTRDQLIKRFSLEHVQKSPAVFDIERLNWMNGLYIRTLEPDQLLDRILEQLGDSDLAKMIKKDRPYSLAAVQLIQERMKRLNEAEELMDFFYTDPEVNKLDFGKINLIDVKDFLEITIKELTAHPQAFNDFGKELEDLMRQSVLPKSGIDKPGPLFMTIRIALTGKTATPGLFETMVALGQPTVLRRLQAALKSSRG